MALLNGSCTNHVQCHYQLYSIGLLFRVNLADHVKKMTEIIGLMKGSPDRRYGLEIDPSTNEVSLIHSRTVWVDTSWT